MDLPQTNKSAMYSAIVNKHSCFEKDQKTLLKNEISTDNQIEDNSVEKRERKNDIERCNISSQGMEGLMGIMEMYIAENIGELTKE